MAVDVWGERRKRIGTGELNRLLAEATARQVPPAAKNRRPRLYYATQAAIEPPTFIFFANDAELIHFSYRRYLENRIRDVLGFNGTPIRLVFRNRGAERPRAEALRAAEWGSAHRAHRQALKRGAATAEGPTGGRALAWRFGERRAGLRSRAPAARAAPCSAGPPASRRGDASGRRSRRTSPASPAR